jgi:hypothetical protein
MDLWHARTQSQEWSSTDLISENKHLADGYALIDECIGFFNQVSEKEQASLIGRFARVCALTTAKGRNLLLGCQSLSLDALAQESGALLRPLLETIELLNYFRLDYNRVDLALDGKLPSPGNIAKSIDGQFQFLRDHLNEQASHFSLGYHSVYHLLDKQTMTIKPVDSHSMEILRTNLVTLSAFMSFLLLESVGCLFITGLDANELADRAEQWKKTCVDIFKMKVKNNK